MSPDLLRRLQTLKRILLNEHGQLSIFIALIFQILFVFFAMIINIGLMVHDKINLQNAADLAVYYAAERQSEILNQIAHVNYQIRQDYKLLTWRYRVLGTLGRGGSRSGNDQRPPALAADASSLSEKAYVNAFYQGEDLPSVCVVNPAWTEAVQNSSADENICFMNYGVTVPKIPDLPTIAPFVPGLVDSAAFTKQAQQFQMDACIQRGPMNWAFLAQLIYDYKISIAARKELIYSLRQNLLAADPLDLANQSVKAGVQATLTKNLTESNRDGAQPIQLLNGLSLAKCNPGDGGEFVLPEILISPKELYSFQKNCTSPSGATFAQALMSDTSQLDQGQVAKYDPTGVLRGLAAGEASPPTPLNSSLGFEKNPWCMAYMGVKVTTQSRKPFSPFGTPTTLTARAFAQPFGGRIGPWYRSNWPNGAGTSSGGNRVDPLTVPRIIGSALDTVTSNSELLPNFSRFPGDQLGMKSEIPMGAENAIITGYTSQDKKNRLHMSWYTTFDKVPTTGDALVSASGASAKLRQAEIAAVAPDLFDAVYYSIDPNYYQAYVSASPVNRAQGLAPVLGQTVAQLPDLGGSLADSTNAGFNVAAQIETAVKSGIDPKVLPKAYYLIRDWTHLLTGWVANGLQDFSFPKTRFATCPQAASQTLPIPGECWQGGGRVGYSVRLISKSALTSQTWNIGGEGAQPGGILNPPSSDF